jgi:transcriptional regulator with XRE-family HTH domain
MGKVSNPANLTRSLRKALGGITQAELAARLLVSRNYISQIEASLKTPSKRLLAQMEAMLTEATGNTDKVSTQFRIEEGPGTYRVSSPPPMRINPGREPPAAEATEQLCHDHLDEYLRRGRTEPGWVGYTYNLLRRKLSLEELDRLKQQPP